jgi:site-specific recombinase XerC
MYQDYQRRLQRIIAVAGLIEIADIDAAWARMFVAHRRRQGATDPEINAEWQLLRDLLKWCCSRGIGSAIPVMHMSLADLGLSMDMSSYPLRRLGRMHYLESQRWWNH